MKTYRKWVYHKEKEPKVINSDELSDYEAEGWKESPALFAGTYDSLKSSAGVDSGKELTPGEVTALGIAMDDVKEIENFKLNVDKERSKKKIIAFLEERNTSETPIDIPKDAGIKQLRELVHSL